MVSALANWKRLKWIKPDQSLSVQGSPKPGFGAEQRVNQGIAIDPETPMRHTVPRTAYAAHTAQINRMDVTQVRRLLRLTLLAPEVLARLTESSTAVLEHVMRQLSPNGWSDQMRVLAPPA